MLEIEFLTIQKTDVIWPEFVACRLCKECQQFGHLFGTSGRIWVSRIAHDTDHSVFRQWASSPCMPSDRGKPVLSFHMMCDNRVDQGDQDAHVQ